MKTMIVGGLVILTVLSMMPAAAPLPAPVGVTAVGGQFLPPVIAAPAGSLLRFESLEATLHHNVLRADNGAFIGHLMPTQGWTCVPGQFASTCFDMQVGASGSVLLYRCNLHPWMAGAVVAV